MEEKLHIDKLNGENFNIWKFKIKLFLVHKECWSAIEASSTVTSSVDQKALAIIGLAIKDDQIVHVQNSKTAKEAWDALHEVYEDSGTASKVMLQDQLMTTKLASGESVKGHIGKLRSIVSKLSTISVVISDDQYVIILLRSLPQEFDQLVVTLENLENLKIEDVHARIIREEERRKSKIDNSQSTALQSHVKHHPMRKTFKCYYCNKPGHKMAQCRRKKYDDQRKQRTNVPTSSDEKQSYAMIATTNNRSEEWFVDSGASYHITGNEKLLQKESIKKIAPVSILLGNGTKVQACETGTVKMIIEDDTILELQEVLLCPEMSSNLLSVLRIQEKGYKVIFESNICEVFLNEYKVFSTRRCNNSFKLQSKILPATQSIGFQAKSTDSIQLWHERFGHFNNNSLLRTVSKEHVEGIPSSITRDAPAENCKGCIAGKLTNTSFSSHSRISTTQELERIHSDVCGPLHPPSFQKSKFFVTFIDDWSRMLFAYPIRTKDQVSEKINHFINLVHNQKDKRMKKIRTDNGGEYINRSVQNTTERFGIVHEKSPPYTPQMNGVAERFNRTIVEMIRSMLHHNSSPLQLWAEALQTAVYLINLQPKKILDWKSPLEIWTGQKPDVTHLRVFGCPVEAYVSVKLRRKLESKVRKLVFVGYTLSPRIYRLMDPFTKRIFDSARLVFYEQGSVKWTNLGHQSPPSVEDIDLSFDFNEDTTQQHPSNLHVSTSNENLPISSTDHDSNNQSEGNTVHHESDPVSEGIRRSTRNRTVPTRLTYEHVITDDEDADVAAMVAHVDEPNTVQDAMSSENAEYWKAAMKSEYDALLENDTWTMCKLPKDRSTINCRWVFKLKHDSEGMASFKARLVAKGYSQIYGVDYFNTYAPVIKLSTVRLLLSLAVCNNLHVHQMDCSSAFLNGLLDEEIYMKQPESFQDGSKMVCKLNKAIYGLKQAPRQWFLRIGCVLNEIGFVMSLADNGMYLAAKGETEVYLGLYVDDMLLASKNVSDLDIVKTKLSSNFKMKDLGPVKKFLNIDVMYKKKLGVMALSQKGAIARLLEKFQMQNCSSVATPITNVKDLYYHNDAKLESNFRYRQLIGSLMFVMLGSRPDLAFTVTVLSRFLENPHQNHWKAAKRVLRYLKGTKDLALVYRSAQLNSLSVYSDADWANSNDRKSVSGIAIFYSNNLIHWTSRKQNCITLSSTESELVAVNDGLKDGIWVQKILNDIGQKICLDLYTDNISCINISHQQGNQNRTKHIDVRYLYIQEKLKHTNTTLTYCPSPTMPADVLTKPLPLSTLLDQLDLLHLCPTSN